MTDHYSSQTDDSIAENTNSEKSVSLYLSETESKRDEEKLDAVIEEFLNIIHPQNNRSSRKINLWLGIAPAKWQQFLLGSSLFCFALFILVLFNYQLTKIWFVSILVTLTLCITLFVLYFLVHVGADLQSPRDNTQRRLNQIKSKNVAEKEKVSRLRELASNEKLKLFEIEIERAIRKAQTQEKFNSRLSAILSIFMVVFFVFFLGIRIDLLEKDWFKGIIGLVALLTQLLNFMIALFSKIEIDGLSKCLAILKKSPNFN